MCQKSDGSVLQLTTQETARPLKLSAKTGRRRGKCRAAFSPFTGIPHHRLPFQGLVALTGSLGQVTALQLSE